MIKEKVFGLPKYRHAVPGLICPGCGHGIAGRLIVDVIDELGIADNVIHVFGIGCGGYASFTFKLDAAVCSHGTAPAVATGIKRALYGRPIVFTYQGDGDAIAIGAGALINAAARGEKITVIMGNNANYGTTGGQLAPTTLLGQKTTTTPSGRDKELHGFPIHTAEMLVPIEGVVYSARGSVNNPANYQRTKKYVKAAFQKQIDNEGFTFVEILVACPTDWHLTPVESLKWMEEKMIPEFPLGEFKNISQKKPS